MKKVLVATEKPFAKVAVNGIRQVLDKAGYELVLLEKYTNVADLLSAVADVDALIVRSDKVTKEVIDAAKNLKIVVRAGAGFDNLDLAACTEKGIVAMNTPGQNSNAVAELALGMMVAQARNSFNGTSGYELRGKKIGIHAYGYVGKMVANIAKGFGMEVLAFDPFVSKEVIEKDGVKAVSSVEELYKSSNFVSLHIPKTKETVNSINYDLLKLMQSPAVLVNTARKEVVDEAGIMKTYEERADFAYLSDIAPDCAAEIQAKYPGRSILTPKKMGAETSEANINAGLAAANQIVKFIETGDKTFQVNK